jgi:hypothetical protein
MSLSVEASGQFHVTRFRGFEVRMQIISENTPDPPATSVQVSIELLWTPVYIYVPHPRQSRRASMETHNKWDIIASEKFPTPALHRYMKQR